jgi:hypothetical protein
MPTFTVYLIIGTTALEMFDLWRRKYDAKKQGRMAER